MNIYGLIGFPLSHSFSEKYFTAFFKKEKIPAVFKNFPLESIEQFNEFFKVELSDEDADTIGGLVTSSLSRMPRRGDKIILEPFEFEVLRADARQVHVLMVRQLAQEELELLQEKTAHGEAD